MPISLASLQAVFLDTSPLSQVTRTPGRNADADACRLWSEHVAGRDIAILVPEIADYELRRELLRTNNINSVARLDVFAASIAQFLPLDTTTLREAAQLWANLRNAGIPTASKDALDGDTILAAQVFAWCRANTVALSAVAVATSNVGDLTRYTDAEKKRLQAARWQDMN